MNYPGLVGDLTAGEPIELNPAQSNCTVEYLNVNESAISTTSVYPNPATSHFQIEMQSSVANVEVFDAFGKVIYKGDYHTGDQVDVSGFPSGIYTICVKQKDKWLWTKLIVAQ